MFREIDTQLQGKWILCRTPTEEHRLHAMLLRRLVQGCLLVLCSACMKHMSTYDETIAEELRQSCLCSLIPQKAERHARAVNV